MLLFSRRHGIKSAALFPLGGFPADDGGLAGFAPAVVAPFAGGTDDAVAGYQEGDGIVANRRAHRTARLRVVDFCRDVAVGCQSAHRDFEQCFPHFQLEVRSFQVQFYLLEFAPILRKNKEGVLLQSVHYLLILCIGKFTFQVVNADRMIVRKFQTAN